MLQEVHIECAAPGCILFFEREREVEGGIFIQRVADRCERGAASGLHDAGDESAFFVPCLLLFAFRDFDFQEDAVLFCIQREDAGYDIDAIPALVILAALVDFAEVEPFRVGAQVTDAHPELSDQMDAVAIGIEKHFCVTALLLLTVIP